MVFVNVKQHVYLLKLLKLNYTLININKKYTWPQNLYSKHGMRKMQE